MVLDYRKNELEEQMLMNLHKKSWTDGLKTVRYETHSSANEKVMKVERYLHLHERRSTTSPCCCSYSIVGRADHGETEQGLQ